MNKRHLHHILRILKRLPSALLVIAFVSALACFVYAYRGNNLAAVKLRDELLQVDKDNGDVEASLRSLREFTYTHMNAGLASDNGVYPPIQLKYRYERLLETARASAAKPRDDSQIAADAAAHCGVRVGVRNECVQSYQESQVTAQPASIPDALYKFDFVAPIWSPDLAGWSLIAATTFGLALLIRVSAQKWLERQIRGHA